MRTRTLVPAIALLLMPVAAFAYGKRSIGSTTSIKSESTTGTFIDRRVWLPGKWTVQEGTGSLVFTRANSAKTVTSTVALHYVPKDQCAFGIIRMRALKAWGGSNLEQSQGRIEALSFGTIKFKGYTWVQPSKWNGDRYWCMGQDMKGAVEISAPVGDTEITTFIKNDLMLQLAVRSGRSVLPYPTAATQYWSSVSARSSSSSSAQ